MSTTQQAYPTRVGLSRRTVLSGALASGAVAAGLAGCTSPAAPSGSKKALTLLLLGPSQQLLAHVKDKVIPAFTQASGYQVELQSSDWASAFQKVTTAAASNSLADVLLIGGIWTAPLASKKVLLDLTDRLASWADTSQFYPGMLADCVWEDKTYAIPYGGDVRVGMYRKDLLDGAGVSALPSTWDEFRAAAVKVKAAGTVKFPIDWGIDKGVGLQQSFAQLFLQAGGRYWDDAGKASFSGEAGTRALSYLVETYTAGLADYNMVNAGTGANNLTKGLAAMTFTGAGAVLNAAQYDKTVVDKLAAGKALVPAPGGTSKPVAWINKLAISAGTADPEGAWALLTHLVSKEELGTFDQLSQVLPARQDLSNESWLDPVSKEILASAPEAISQPPHPSMLQVGPAIATLLQAAIRGESTVAKTLTDIDQKVDSISG